MRAHGVVTHPHGLGVHDHVCWAYDSVDDFRTQARGFLADGLLAGQQILYVGAADHASLLDDLRGIDGLVQALSDDRAHVASVGDTYPPGAPITPAAQARVYTDLTEQAVMAGRAGLRVAADVTSLVGTPARRDAFARYEHLVDRYMAVRPMAAMCGYSRAALSDDEITTLACMHPAATPGTTAFRIHGTDRPGCAAAVSGDVDVDVADLWRLALERADLRPVRGAELVLDASGLTFIDHQRLLELVDYAYQRNTPVVLRDGPEMAARLIDLLNIPFARVESSHGR